MKCKEAHKNLIFYLEGSLDSTLNNGINEHLAACPDCRGFADKLRLTNDIIEEEKEFGADTDFFEKITERMEAESKRTIGPLMHYLRTAVAAAVVVLGILSGVNIARVTTSNTLASSNVEFSEEFYSLNDLYKEPIESFFLLNDLDNE